MQCFHNKAHQITGWAVYDYCNILMCWHNVYAS